MKKTQKKIFGLLGLSSVVAMTFVAATMPSPMASATTSSVTDTITVEVVASVADVKIISPDSEAVTTGAETTIRLRHNNVDTATLVLTKINPDSTTTEYTLANYTFGEDGEEAFNLNLHNASYGYGEYIVTLRGTGDGGSSDEDSIRFTFLPVTAEVTENEDTGEVTVDLDYDPYDESDPSSTGEVAEIIINVYDEDGNLVDELSPIVVTPPDTSVTIPFDDYDLPDGKYTITTTAYDKDGNQLYESYIDHAIHHAIPVPNTGGLLANLNISKSDYLITGIIVFLLTGIFGIVFIAKKQRKSTRRR